MNPIHRILVAIKDLRARQLPAVAKAARLAHALDAEVCRNKIARVVRGPQVIAAPLLPGGLSAGY
jgi:hypothetical protein